MNRAQITRAEQALSPQQAAIHLFQHLVDAEDPDDFTLRAYDVFQEADPADRIKQIRSSTAAAMRGHSAEVIRRAGLNAAAEYYFLFSLFSNVSRHVVAHWEAFVLRATLAVSLCPVTQMLWPLLPTNPWADNLRVCDTIRREGERAVAFLVASEPIFTGTLRAAEDISRTYANGRPILFRGAVERLRHGERCVALLRKGLAYADMEPEPMASEATDKFASDPAHMWVDQAKSDLYAMRGEDTEAEKIFARLMHPPQP